MRFRSYPFSLVLIVAACDAPPVITDDAPPPDPAPAPWVNPGCEEPINIVSSEVSALSVDVDLRDFVAREYTITETITVRTDVPARAVTLYGVSLLLGDASHGYAYDGQRATFCVVAPAAPALAAGDEVTITITYVVSEATQNFPAGNVFGIHQWENSRDDVVIGAYSAPFFTSTWLLAPGTVPWVDATHDGNPSVDAVDLTVRVKDASWTVIGPGIADVDADPELGDAWRFHVEGAMPIYTLSFAASPRYVQIEGETAASGLAIQGASFASTATSMAASLRAARTGVDWMEQNIGAYRWPTALTFAEVPGYPGGFEHTSAVWLGSTVVDGSAEADYVAIHEAVHHWFGNDVRVADWPHFWLSEGFAEWLTVFAIMDDDDRRREYRRAAAALSQPSTTGGAPAGPLRFPDDGDFVTQLNAHGLFFYRYGAAFLDMIDKRLQRDHATSLPAVLAAWFAHKQGTAATTEELLEFLIDETGDDLKWTSLFEEWVYASPAPILELRDYAVSEDDGSGARTVSFVVHRVAGAQDLSELEVVVDDTIVTVPLSGETDDATVSIELAAEPTSVRVDRDGFYILKIRAEAGWSGPSVQ